MLFTVAVSKDRRKKDKKWRSITTTVQSVECNTPDGKCFEPLMHTGHHEASIGPTKQQEDTGSKLLGVETIASPRHPGDVNWDGLDVLAYSSRRDPNCHIDGLECSRMDAEHWKVAPFWTRMLNLLALITMLAI